MLIPTMKKPRAHLCETGAVVSVYKFVIDLKEVRQNGLCFSSIASGHRSAPHFLNLDADRCPLVTREHKQNGYPEFF